MDLKTFIKETLCQISEGMIEAQEELEGKSVRINPPHVIDVNGNFLETNEKTQHFQSIEFDIALTASEATKAEGGASIKVWSATIGGQKGKTASIESVSRVKFSISALLPQSIREPRDERSNLEQKSYMA